MKYEFNQEKDELCRQLAEKEAQIKDLKSRVDDSKPKKKEEDDDDDGFVVGGGGGKSRARLQGEVLQLSAKLHEKEAKLESQGRDLESTKEELAKVMDGNELVKVKLALENLQQIQKAMVEEIANERKETSKKLKEKDETVGFLMTELARLKQEQSLV
eukprot:jgi/Psemu1/308343/fgenesh1_kg.402_\